MGGVITRVLKAKKDPPLKKDKYEGLTPSQKVHAAACDGDVAELERLAAEGVDMNEPRHPDGLMALDACAFSGCMEGAMTLIRLGADPAQTVQAVVGAATWGNPELLEALLEKGGPVDQELSQQTALRWAVEYGNEDCAVILVRRGAWKLEPLQDLVLMRAQSRRMRQLLESIAQADPERAEDCVLQPCWRSCGCEVL